MTDTPAPEGPVVWNPSDAGADTMMGSRWMTAPSIRLQKIFAAELLVEPEPLRVFLNIQQISVEGMRIHSDRSFEPGASLRIRLQSERPVVLPVSVEWQKELHGGMWSAGLRFEPETDEEAEAIEVLVSALALQNRRRHVRVMRVLAVEVLLDGGRPSETRHGTFTMDLSAGGMRILHEGPLPSDQDVPLRILLEYDLPPVEVIGRVAWQREATFQQHQIGIEFADVPPETAERIEDFVEGVLAGELAERAIPALEGFEEDSSTSPS